ncbi:AI-2E family transporter [Sphingomicrobium astaxanthinifaciens]|uniref:AI-2E family transporter n=1 Tax=Sphingomicrobium astaxanthinifaciens TaxID=1227949 RepID=UPI001FCBE941|nr:AI-2E family transporter [Sphingomicrobium astaxanthinifaciens]MCJ7421608.1 AI-2E family transporter [Sphingomicrobium astaxanthinifaciens]
MSLGEMVRRTLVVLLVIGLAMLLPLMANTLLLIFGAILIAVLVRAAAIPFQHLGLGNTASVLLGLAAILVLLGLFGWLFGAQLSGQFATLQAQLAQAVPEVRDQLARLPFVGSLAGTTPDVQELAGRALNFAFGLLGLLTNLVLVIVGAAYLALDPGVYQRGLAKLFPKDRSAKVVEALEASGQALRRYLLGQLATMTIVGLMVWIGLAILGIPSAAALGLTIGVANFIPLVGPFIGAIPGLIIAFSAAPELFWYAVLVYLVAQQIEGNVLTPMVQNWAVSIPPALLIFSLAALGGLFGFVGVVLAAPLTVVIYTLVTMLWSRDALGHEVKVPGRELPKAEGAA